MFNKKLTIISSIVVIIAALFIFAKLDRASSAKSSNVEPSNPELSKELATQKIDHTNEFDNQKTITNFTDDATVKSAQEEIQNLQETIHQLKLALDKKESEVNTIQNSLAEIQLKESANKLDSENIDAKK